MSNELKTQSVTYEQALRSHPEDLEWSKEERSPRKIHETTRRNYEKEPKETKNRYFERMNEEHRTIELFYILNYYYYYYYYY